jgi:hypothetical protein
VLVVVVGASGSSSKEARLAAPRLAAATMASEATPLFPLEISRNRRYLVDHRKRPFLLVGDSPQALISKLSARDTAAYIANRKAAGINALWVNLLCVAYTGCPSDAKTFDGIAPFKVSGDLSTPNPAYFARADQMIRLAAKAGIVVFLDPIETGGWLGVLRANGPTKAFAYGRFLGKRYKNDANIVWLNGNDFQSWQKSSDDALVLAVAKGIRSVDKSHLQTVELNYFESGSFDDPRWRPIIGLDLAYTYGPTYARVLREYNRPRFLPVVMIEAGYESEQNNGSISRGDPLILRRQEYWSMLSGAAGQFYGNHYTWQFIDGWRTNLNTVGTAELGHLVKLFASRPWFKLVPDQAHKFVTGGFGTYATTGNVGASDYTTAAATPDGTLAIAYLPDSRTVTLNLSRLRPNVVGQWFDPTKGTYTPIPASALAGSPAVRLTPPGDNAGGDGDWVLVLSAR